MKKLLHSPVCVFVLGIGFSFPVFGQKLDSIQFNLLFDSIETLNYTGKPDAAFQLSEELYKRAVNDFGENTSYAAAAALALGVAHLGNSNFAEAENLFRQSLDTRKRLFGNDYQELPPTLNALASVYSNSGKPYQALPLLEEALRILKLYYPPGHYNYGQTFNNLGIAYDKLGEFDKALVAYHQSLAAKEKNPEPNPIAISNTYNNLAGVHLMMEDLEKSIEYFRISQGILEKNNLKVTKEYALGLMNLGACWNRAKNFQLSRKYIDEARELSEIVFKKDPLSKGLLYYNIGASFIESNELTDAAASIKTAIDTFETVLGKGNYFEMHCLIALGQILMKQGQPDSSLKLFKKSLEIALAILGKNHNETILVMNNLGTAYDHLKMIPEAIEVFRSAVVHYEEKFTLAAQPVTPGLDYLDAQVNLTNMLLGKYLKKDKNDERLQEIKAELAKSMAVFETLKAMSNDFLTKQTLVSSNYSLMEIAIETAMLEDQHLAFDYAERCKANNLLSTINEQKDTLFPGIPLEILAKEKSLKSRITFFEKQIGVQIDELDFEKISEFQFKLDSLKKQFKLLKNDLKEIYPQYYNLKYADATVSVGEVQQKLLQPGETLLEYFLGDSVMFIFLVQKDNYRVFELKPDSLKAWVTQLQEGIFGYYSLPLSKQTSDIYAKTLNQYVRVAPKIYQKLIAPVAGYLTGEIVVIPDGELGYVPFEALLPRAPEPANNLGDCEFLINKYNFSYCYSATLLREMRGKQYQQRSDSTLLAFAPFSKSGYRKNNQDIFPKNRDNYFGITRDSLAPLKYSGEEVKHAADTWKGKYLLDKEASKARFLKSAGYFRILHLSTHASANMEKGADPYLAFFKPAQSMEDAFLYAADIYNLLLQADLIILSACETNRGVLQRGEGIISLARAFTYAGAKSLVTTLWVVDDYSTEAIMGIFHAGLKKGLTKNVALYEAKRQFMEANPNERHPFYWAGLIPVGDMSPIR
jgi:CHAT domain-containing protein